jgi:zinc transport system permease protein
MSIFSADFMRLAFAAGAVVGVLAPAVGFFLVQRRMSLIGDGIGHVAFAGVALGYLIGVSPVATALVASVAGAVTIEWLRAHRRAAGDQALALLFYTGIAAGVVLVSAAGALNANLFAFLFGSILTVTHGDLLLVTILGALGLALIAALYPALVAAALDEEGARVSGVPVGLLNIVLAGLAGVTIAVSMRIVGILLIAALMVLPVIAASRIAWSIGAERLLVCVLRIAGNLLGDGANLLCEDVVIFAPPEQFVRPLLGSVVRRQIVLEQELAKRDADADVREGSKGEQPSRGVHHPVDVGALALELVHDHADRLVDERDPQIFEIRHARILEPP